jgi:hypothetical protein
VSDQALCSRHNDKSAVVNCHRCGDFLCKECHFDPFGNYCEACLALVWKDFTAQLEKKRLNSGFKFASIAIISPTLGLIFFALKNRTPHPADVPVFVTSTVVFLFTSLVAVAKFIGLALGRSARRKFYSNQYEELQTWLIDSTHIEADQTFDYELLNPIYMAFFSTVEDWVKREKDFWQREHSSCWFPLALVVGCIALAFLCVTLGQLL